MQIPLNHLAPFVTDFLRYFRIAITGQINKIQILVDIPGDAEVLASDFRFNNPLISEDFPTFDLPAKAISGNVFSGNLLVMPHTVSNSADLITITRLNPLALYAYGKRFSSFLVRLSAQ